jgi:hypothetical protein
MAKSPRKQRRRSTRSHNNTEYTTSTTKQPANPTKKNPSKRSPTSPIKDSTNADTQATAVSPTPRKGNPLPPTDNQHHFELITNSNDQHILLAPLSIPLSELFTNIDTSFREVIQSYCFNDRTLERDDDKELDIFMKRGAKMMNLDHDPDPQDWFTLFENAYVSLEPEFTDPGNDDDMRDFGLNLAASDPLILFRSL